MSDVAIYISVSYHIGLFTNIVLLTRISNIFSSKYDENIGVNPIIRYNLYRTKSTHLIKIQPFTVYSSRYNKFFLLAQQNSELPFIYCPRFSVTKYLPIIVVTRQLLTCTATQPAQRESSSAWTNRKLRFHLSLHSPFAIFAF